jgi:hypothetical protein
MKTTLLTALCSIALALTVFGQTPTPPASPTATAVTSTISPVVAPTATPEDEDSIEKEVARKLKRKFGVTIDTKDIKDITRITRHDRNGDDDEDFGALMAIPIIGIIFGSIFFAPVMVVAAIMFFSYLKNRSLHRTVKTMVEKGQEVPAALFAPPPVVRAKSDMRKGVVLIMVGIGVMIFFGAMSEWEGGSWAFGIIPFLIGLGYLLVWKLEGPKDKAPPLP